MKESGDPPLVTGYRITGSLSRRNLFLNSRNFKVLHPDELYARMMNNAEILSALLDVVFKNTGGQWVLQRGRLACSECQDGKKS